LLTPAGQSVLLEIVAGAARLQGALLAWPKYGGSLGLRDYLSAALPIYQAVSSSVML
jgi:hypothetical protein